MNHWDDATGSSLDRQEIRLKKMWYIKSKNVQWQILRHTQRTEAHPFFARDQWIETTRETIMHTFVGPQLSDAATFWNGTSKETNVIEVDGAARMFFVANGEIHTNMLQSPLYVTRHAALNFRKKKSVSRRDSRIGVLERRIHSKVGTQPPPLASPLTSSYLLFSCVVAHSFLLCIGLDPRASEKQFWMFSSHSFARFTERYLYYF